MSKPSGMSFRQEQLRRASLICISFAKNLAIYRSTREHLHDSINIDPRTEDILINISNNSFDICSLDWCKIFIKKGSKHYFQSLATDKEKIVRELYEFTGMNKISFDMYCDKFRNYRNQFVAHQDIENIQNHPNCDIALESVIFFHNYIIDEESGDGWLQKDFNEVGSILKAFTQYRENMKLFLTTIDNIS
jgi:hypothetical protein